MISQQNNGRLDGLSDIISENGQQRHAKGCNCKKSKCLKKYCECFQAGVPCDHNCKCIGCKNFEGCDERKCILEHNAQIAAAQQMQQQQMQIQSQNQVGTSDQFKMDNSGQRYLLNQLNGPNNSDHHLAFMNLSPVKPIDISACQEECANTFGFDFDIKFCKMPEAIYQDKKDNE